MIILALLFAGLAASEAAPQESFEIVSSIVVRTDKLSAREFKASQQYAHCMSLSFFPIQSEFTARHDKCRKARSVRKPSAALGSVLDHLDHVVAQSPGSEATLTVTNSNAPNQ